MGISAGKGSGCVVVVDGVVAAAAVVVDGGVVFGAVTTGVLWRFLRLEGVRAEVDGVEYPIQSPRRVYGILQAIALGDAA